MVQQSAGIHTRGEKGFALIDLIFVCGVIGVLTSMAMPRLLQARQAAGSASAVGTLRTLNSSQLSYAFTCGGGYYAPSLTTLGAIPPGATEGFIPPALSLDDVITHSNYVLQMTGSPFPGAPATCNGLGAGEASQGFKAANDSIEATNPRHFGTNASMTILEDTATLWDDMPENGDSPVGHLID